MKVTAFPPLPPLVLQFETERNNRIQESFLLWEITQPWMEPCPGTMVQRAKEKGNAVAVSRIKQLF